MSRDHIREFNGYLFAVLSQLLATYDFTPPSTLRSPLALLRVDELDPHASRWLGVGSTTQTQTQAQTHSLLVEALLFARDHYSSTAPTSTVISSGFPVALQTVTIQLLDAFARVSAQSRRFAEQLITTALQQLDTIAAVADINTILHVLELEVSLIGESTTDSVKVGSTTEEMDKVGGDGDTRMEVTAAGDEDKPTDADKATSTVHWRVLAIVDGRLESATSDSAAAANATDPARRLNGLLQIIQNEHERDTRKAYLCIKFLVQQAQRCDAIRFYLTHPADRWEWCCNWLRNLMTHGLDGVAEARRGAAGATATSAVPNATGTLAGYSSSSSSSVSTALVPYREPNGSGAAPTLVGPQPLGRTINYGTFQRTTSATVTLQGAMDMINDTETPEPDATEKLDSVKQDELMS